MTKSTKQPFCMLQYVLFVIRVEPTAIFFIKLSDFGGCVFSVNVLLRKQNATLSRLPKCSLPRQIIFNLRSFVFMPAA